MPNIYLKLESHLPKKLVFICFSARSLKKIKKKSFLSHLKSSLFVLKIFNFCPNFSSHVGKRLDKKVKVDFKIMTQHIGKKITAIQKLTNIVSQVKATR